VPCGSAGGASVMAFSALGTLNHSKPGPIMLAGQGARQTHFIELSKRRTISDPAGGRHVPISMERSIQANENPERATCSTTPIHKGWPEKVFFFFFFLIYRGITTHKGGPRAAGGPSWTVAQLGDQWSGIR